ncbi:hypothetical protein Scep_009128 [Stephania cephalantha]|uniref:Uncharacterized protein n=1 Tax=Stephania cephalantha TaxID=152367 RepID=A0AAP0PCU0_9MAGN
MNALFLIFIIPDILSSYVDLEFYYFYSNHITLGVWCCDAMEFEAMPSLICFFKESISFVD